MLSRLTLLLKLFYSPLDAMASIRTQTPYVAGGVLALISSLVYYDALTGELWLQLTAAATNASQGGASMAFFGIIRLVMSAAAPVVFLAVIFCPATLFAVSIIDRRSRFVILRQEYAPLVSCILYSWAATHIFMLGPALLLFRPDPQTEWIAQLALRIAPLPYFAFLVVIALRVLLRMGYGMSIGSVLLASTSLIALPLVPQLLLFLSSPFLLILVIILLRSFLGDLISGHHARERFKQNLEAATLNPADSSAHYNLGLIYQQRGMYDEAKTSFNKAIEIDPDEIDAHYQLGRIAREEGRLSEAVTHFDCVVRSEPHHSQNEVWREIGSVYYQAGQYDDARSAFERFLERRGSDAEGRFRYGLTLQRLGRPDEAFSEMKAVIEAVRTAPAYKYRTERKWMTEAQAFLRSKKNDNKSAG